MTDDVDDEFRDIVASMLADLDELDDLAIDESSTTEPDEAEPAPAPVKTSYELTTPRSWTPPPEDDTFVPPPPLPPAKVPSSVALVGLAAIIVGVVILGGVVIGQISSSWGTTVGFLAVCAGVVVLFTRLPKNGPGSDNGARL
jgi:hypothetical protein